MPLVINTNVASLKAQRQILSTNNAVDQSTERLSSGRRINSSADDAAGLSISNRMTSQIRGLAQAVRNANDGVSLIQTAEGALSESTNILQRMRELSIQSANGVYGEEDRATLDTELQQLVAELSRIAETTTFNNQPILNGSLGDVELQVGAEEDQTISLALSSVDASDLGMNQKGGDVVGSTLSLNGSGRLSNEIGENDVLINGQSIGRLSVGDTVDELLASIHSSVNGIEASTLLEIEATNTGSGALGDGDLVTLTYVGNNGATTTVSVTGTSSLPELADAITERTGGRVAAALNDSGRLVLTSTDIASLSISDSTGSATGITAGSISAGSVQQSVINGLNSYWIQEAETLITDYFDLTAPGSTEIDLIFAETDGTLTGDVSGLTAGQQATLVSDGAGGGVAAVWNDPANLKLIIDLADFVSAEGSAPLYNDRIIAHEMVHAVMAAVVPSGVNTLLPGWFSEGIAEFIHGADERVLSDIQANTPPSNPTSVGIAAVVAALKTTPGSPSDSAGYSAGYTAVRMLHDEILASGNAAGISAVLDSLDSGTTLDTAISALGITWSGGIGLSNFETYFSNTADEYLSDALNGTTTYTAVSAFGTTARMDLTDADTGSVAGSDYSGATLTAASVLPNTATGGPISFDLTLPDGYSASSVGVNAKLVLTSTQDAPVTIERGTTGRLADLTFLGFQESGDSGVINGVAITQPAEPWDAGELTINGQVVDVTDTDSFQGKLDAINRLTEQTGVIAESYASAMLQLDKFDFDLWSTTPYGDFQLNGIILDGVGDVTSIEELTEVFNQFSEQTGVTARRKGTDIVLESMQTIVFADVPVLGPDAAIAFGQSTLGDARLLTSNSDASNGESEAVTDGSTVQLGIRLKSLDGSPISVDVGDLSSSIVGLTNVNKGLYEGGSRPVSSITIDTQEAANRAIDVIDIALETINDLRSELGAVNNRLVFTMGNLSSVIENSQAARSRIVDADFASEASRLSISQMIQSASSSMLVQANARNELILTLLQN